MPEEILDDCSFATVRTENMGYCPNKESVGGIKADVYYIPMAQLATVTKPTVDVDTTYEAAVTIPALETEKLDTLFSSKQAIPSFPIQYEIGL